MKVMMATLTKACNIEMIMKMTADVTMTDYEVYCAGKHTAKKHFKFISTISEQQW
jgi:hypothetical protein